MHPNRIALAVVSASLAVAPPVGAHLRHHHHHKHHHKHAHHKHHHKHAHHRHHHRPARDQRPPIGALTVGMGNVQTLGCASLPLTGTTFVRVIAGYKDSVSRFLPCAQAAQAAGLRVLLVVQWGNSWSLDQIRQRFADALNAYKSVRPFAVGVGNEQEGPWNDGPGESGAQYAAIWRAVEPMVAAAFPRAIRIAGETSPWGVAFMAAAARAGLPGAQAYAYHAYPAKGSGGSGAAQLFTSIARANKAQAWADEGLCGPSSWNTLGCSTNRELSREGFSLAAEWYDSTRPGQAPPTIGYDAPPWILGTSNSSPSPSARH